LLLLFAGVFSLVPLLAILVYLPLLLRGFRAGANATKLDLRSLGLQELGCQPLILLLVSVFDPQA
jgi:hypothetical protein